MGGELQYAWISGFTLFILVFTTYVIVKCCGCCAKSCCCKPYVMVFILFIIFLISIIAIIIDTEALAKAPHEEAIREGDELYAPIKVIVDPILKLIHKGQQTDN